MPDVGAPEWDEAAQKELPKLAGPWDYHPSLGRESPNSADIPDHWGTTKATPLSSLTVAANRKAAALLAVVHPEDKVPEGRESL
jgi:hypothetical protein